jgi:ATP-dependent RNA helicase DDX24/MAK5
MIQQGSFPQLEMILDAIQKANPMYDSDDDDSEIGDDEDDVENCQDDRLYALPGIPGEAKVTMLSDVILQQIESERNADKCHLQYDDNVDEKNFAIGETQHNDEDNAMDSLNDDYSEEGNSHVMEHADDDSDVLDLPSKPPVQRQTFVYSATLMLPASGSFKSKKKTNRKGVKKQSVDGAIAEILEKAHAKGITKVVDLTNSISTKKSTVISLAASSSEKGSLERNKASKPLNCSTLPSVRLPEGLAFHVIKCTQRHKDSFLYSYLMTTSAGRAGNSIIFCNSIAAVRRVGATLQVLGIPVRVLHAQMQQVCSCYFCYFVCIVR